MAIPNQKQSDDVQLSRVGSVAHIHLNRSRALNALTIDMVSNIQAGLEEWAKDDSVSAVVITGEGERAFCAGSDVKSIAVAGNEARAAGRLEPGIPGLLTADYFRAEYTLNHTIAKFPKPWVAYLDGITMGGGAGLSIHGHYRIATERTLFAMPETGIGFFPDSGGSFFLTRNGPVGKLLGITGQPVDAATTYALQFATHFGPAGEAERLIGLLANCGVERALEQFCYPSPHSDLAPLLRELCEERLNWDCLTSLLKSLTETSRGEHRLAKLALRHLETIQKRSPTSVAVAFEEFHRAGVLDLQECLKMEFRISQACMLGHDFYEGIRAVLVDKDQDPAWQPSSLELVESPRVAQHFNSLGEHDLHI